MAFSGCSLRKHAWRKAISESFEPSIATTKTWYRRDFGVRCREMNGNVMPGGAVLGLSSAMRAARSLQHGLITLL